MATSQGVTSCWRTDVLRRGWLWLLLACCYASAAPAQTTFSFSVQPATVQPVTGWVPAAANAFPDAFTDVFNFHPSNGTIWPCQNKGGLVYCNTSPQSTLFPTTYRLIALDANADGREDVIAYLENGDCKNPFGPSGLQTELFLMQADNTLGTRNCWLLTTAFLTGWTLYGGDFNADGFDDIVGYQASNGRLYFWKGNGPAGFSGEVQWGSIAPAAGWSFVTGDFDGDGLLDLMGYQKNNGQFRLCRNTGGAFSCTAAWGTIPGSVTTGWTLAAGRFHVGSSRKDIFAFRAAEKTIWVGSNSGSDLRFARWNTFTTGLWTFVSGYFARSVDRGAPESILGIRGTDGRVFIGRPQ
jgi:hypothetical protein